MFELAHDPGRLRGALRWIDPRFGLIPRLEHTEQTLPEPRWHVYAAELSRVPPGRYHSPVPEVAAGASLDPDEALRRALGESIERYCGLHPPPPERVFVQPWNTTELAARFPRCAADEPCPASLRSRPTDSPLPHVLVRRLADDREVAVPAAHVYPAATPTRGEPLVTLGISTGLAFHVDLVPALWSGLCEVAERDAVMITWWTRRNVKRIDTRDAPAPLAARVARLREAGIEPHLFDVTTDFEVPTVFCVLVGPDYPRVLTGASCTSDPLRACTKAIDETIGVRHYARMESDPTLPDEPGFAWVRGLADHLHLYGKRGPAPAMDFLLEEAEHESFADFAAREFWGEPATRADLAALSQRLEDLGLTVLWADLTTPEADPIGHVVRVVVPEMIPLSPDHHIRWLGTPRLLRFASLTDPRPHALNAFPHPFA
jgi:ribosomal protein S12 methylthiotransferase accessory factor